MSGAKKKMQRRASLAEMGLTEKQKQELKEQQAKRRNSILATVAGVVAAVLVIALLVWNSGFIPRHTTALTVKDHKFTVADMDYYYHLALNRVYSQEQFYASVYQDYTPSVDFSADLKTQYVDAEQTQSYYDYFAEQAKENATEVAALYDAAKAAGYTLSEEAQTQLDEALAELDATVKQYNYGSRTAYLKVAYGRGMTEKVYLKNQEMSVLAQQYYNAKTAELADYSDEELKAYYGEDPSLLDTYDYNYVYFDGTAQPTTDADGNQQAVTDEESAAAMAEAKSKAEAVISAVNGGDAETSFASAISALGSTATPQSTLGSNFASMPYNEWLTDSARKEGDVEMFELEGYGYYVVQFQSRGLYDEPTVDVRHILASFADELEEGAQPEVDENGQAVYTDAQKQAAHDKAAAWLEEFNAGDKTAEVFGALAEDHSADRDQNGDLNSEGGLYKNVRKGQMVQPFEDWSFDAARQEGDTGLVETSYGWHVMYFQEYHRPAWMDVAADAKSSDEIEAFMESAKEGYEAVEGSGWSKVGL